MVVLDKTIVIDAPPERVWRVLTRLASSPRWAAGTVRVHAVGAAEEGVRRGLVFETVREDLGLVLGSVAETTAADPPRRFAWRQRAGDFERNDGAWDLAPEGAGKTRLRLRLLLELPFVLPRLITEDVIRRHFSSRYDATLLRLKEEAERDPP